MSEGKQIAGELYPAKSAIENARKRMRKSGFPDARHVLDQQVPLCKQTDQRQA